ncbi:MAG TPA: hypothetical protein VMF52_16270 [Steroidobacteraceae bacterium]|nr:hypothetical protein [Steroidobacteraceae bacterium]
MSISAWYFDRFSWPRKIQTELFGGALATHESLVAFDDNSHFGQGSFRWTYNLSGRASAALSKLCAPESVKNCRFSRSGNPDKQIETSVTFEKGTLVVEEGWL